MKTLHAILIFIAGISLSFIGGLLKVLHLTGGDQLLVISMALILIGGALFVYKLLTNPKFKEFLNW